MKTKIKKIGDMVIVDMDGKLSFETQEPIRKSLSRLAERLSDENDTPTDSAPTKIIFNFEDLEFVGSSGISSFVQTLKDFNDRAPMKPRYCGVRSEFQKFIKAFDEEADFEFFDTEDVAKRSFDN